MIKIITILAFLMLPAFTAGQEIAEDRNTKAHMPSFSELAEGWNTMKPGGETSCAHGTEYEFYARAADPEKLLVYLYGGGACWDAEGCRKGSAIYTAEIDAGHHPSSRGGILDPEHLENPFSSYSMVVIPVCTGDVHLGANDTVYILEDENSGQTEFTIHHRGQTNAMAAIYWIRSNFDSPDVIFVSGSSAGSLGVPLHASFLARQYPNARVTGLGDDANSFGVDSAKGGDPSRWGLPDVLQHFPGWEALNGLTGVHGHYITSGSSADNLRLFQFDHAYDSTQYFYLERTGNPDPDVLALIIENQEIIRSGLPDFRSYIQGGFFHTMLHSSERFYSYQVDGHRLRDWVYAIAMGEDVPNVMCGDCKRPGLIYDEDDLAIIDATIQLISEPELWNPDDEGGSCPKDVQVWSLGCAVQAATEQVTGKLPRMHTVTWDLVNEAIINDGYQWGQGQVLITFNNTPGRTHGEILELLETVRERIRLQLNSEP